MSWVTSNPFKARENSVPLFGGEPRVMRVTLVAVVATPEHIPRRTDISRVFRVDLDLIIPLRLKIARHTTEGLSGARLPCPVRVMTRRMARWTSRGAGGIGRRGRYLGAAAPCLRICTVFIGWRARFRVPGRCIV